jgi:hypothetical protein
MLSAVRTLSCNVNQAKNLHFGSVKALQRLGAENLVVDPKVIS